MQRPICGSLALQKLDLVENFDLVENIAVTIFSTKSVVHCCNDHACSSKMFYAQKWFIYGT